MFGKVIVFGLFEMIKKKKQKKSEDRVLGSGFGFQVGSGTRALDFTLYPPSRWSLE